MIGGRLCRYLAAFAVCCWVFAELVCSDESASDIGQQP